MSGQRNTKHRFVENKRPQSLGNGRSCLCSMYWTFRVKTYGLETWRMKIKFQSNKYKLALTNNQKIKCGDTLKPHKLLRNKIQSRESNK